MTEFAMILPVFLFLLLIAVDVGRLFFSQIEINNAAREGVAYAATSPTDTALIKAHVVQETNAQPQRGAGAISDPVVTCKDPAGATIACSSASGGTGAGNTVTVSVTEPFTFLTPFIQTGFPPLWGGFGNDFKLGSSATAVVLGYAPPTIVTPPGTCTPATASFTVAVNVLTITTNPQASTPNSGEFNISGYNWDWGDGSEIEVGTATSTVHAYAVAGTYTVTLRTTNQCGEATASAVVTVSNTPPPPLCTVPTAFFSYERNNKKVQFEDKSTVADEDNCFITDGLWSFGDMTPPKTSNAENPEFKYTDTATHEVTLIVTNSAGASAPYKHTQ